ncbi:MAG TPA: hypothetical protein VL371_21230, partial [Gemmataceae bacterium]|nr:hypothetical protein [Gemmataceae bacterium]
MRPMSPLVARAAAAAVVILLFACCRGALAADLVPSTQPAGQYGAQAREVTAHLQRTFWDADRKLYVKAASDRTPDYVWREAAA